METSMRFRGWRRFAFRTMNEPCNSGSSGKRSRRESKHARVRAVGDDRYLRKAETSPRRGLLELAPGELRVSDESVERRERPDEAIVNDPSVQRAITEDFGPGRAIRQYAGVFSQYPQVVQKKDHPGPEPLDELPRLIGSEHVAAPEVAWIDGPLPPCSRPPGAVSRRR